uniref:Uncharacterized protein n=1 Tax=Hyaloperonospora arabidopsidis (strain Emoy2) TaxID=559515 RepID=M4BD83_HYAAE
MPLLYLVADPLGGVTGCANVSTPETGGTTHFNGHGAVLRIDISDGTHGREKTRRDHVDAVIKF